MAGNGHWVGNTRISTRPTLSHLRVAIEDNEPRRFKALFTRKNASWEWDKLNENVDQYGNTILVSLCKKGWADCVALLLKEPTPGFDPNFVHPREKLTAVQIAAKLGQAEITRILALDKRTDLNVVSGLNKRTLAHFLILKLVEYKKANNVEKVQQWTQLVLDIINSRNADFSADYPDGRSCTALYFAVKNHLDPELCVALRRLGASLNAADDVDDDVVETFGNKGDPNAKGTIEFLLHNDPGAAKIKEAFEKQGILAQDSVQPLAIPWLHKVDQAIRQNNISALNELLQDEPEAQKYIGEYIAGKTPLTLAASLVRVDMCQLLIPLGGIDRPDDLQWTAMHYAAHHGNATLLTMLLDTPAADDLVNAKNGDENTPLILILRREGRGKLKDYKECFEILLNFKPEDKILDLNAQDKFGNTALHHAVHGWDKETMMALLEKGATMWIRNADGEVPVSKIPTPLLWKFFDTKCMPLGELDENLGRENFELEVDYSFLVSSSPTSSSEGQHRLKPETSCLWWLTQTPNHIEVLRHPVVKIFLHFKWQKIFPVFFMHCAFYVIYLALLFLYLICGAFPAMLIAKGAGQMADEGKSCFKVNLEHEGTSYSLQNDACLGDPGKSAETARIMDNYLEILTWEWNIVRYVLLGLNTIILILELFQLFISPLRYLFGSLVNLFELAMVFSVYGFLLLRNVDDGRTSGVLALLFSLSEVTRLFGQMPVISTYVKMFTTIAWNFVKFLLWYVILVLVYSLSFLLLFYPSTEFQSPFGSLLKTIAMLAGELGFENLPFDQYSIVSQFTFITFVFFVTIVLLNLLTGLAVGETQRIQDRAEVMGYVSQIKLMFYIESMLFRDPENALGRFRIGDKMSQLCRSFLTLKLYRHFASGRKRSGKESCCGRSRTIIDVCPGLGWFLDKIGSSSLVFNPGQSHYSDDEEMNGLKIINNENKVTKVMALSGASSVSTDEMNSAASNKIRILPFEDFHRRVAEPHDELALGDALAEDLVGYIKDSTAAQAEEKDEEDIKAANQLLREKLEEISGKLEELQSVVKDMKTVS